MRFQIYNIAGQNFIITGKATIDGITSWYTTQAHSCLNDAIDKFFSLALAKY